VTRREWVWVMAAAALMVAVSTVPYAAGAIAQTDDLRFGGAVLDAVDYHSHLAKMWQGYRGQWRYRLLFTPEEHEGAFLQTFYVALGHLARVLGLPVSLAYHVGRLIFGFAMLVSIYRFIARFVTSVRTRRVAFLLATIASGLGWLTEAVAPTPPGGVSPMDFWLLDGFTYLALLTSPHFCAAIALLLCVFLLLVRPAESLSLTRGILAVIASLALGVIHPYAMLVADLVPGSYWVLESVRTRRVAWRGLLTVAAMGAAQLPLLLYYLSAFRQPVLAAWSAQNVTLSPPFHVYVLGYGVLLLLGALGLAVCVRNRQRRCVFSLLWLGLVAVLTQVPWNLQRRFLEGVQVPMGLLAGIGVAEGLLGLCVRRVRVHLCSFVAALVLALSAMSNLYLTGGVAWAAAARAPGLFYSADLLAAVDWLGDHSEWDETVFCAFGTGNLIPARIGHRVVLGHWMETVGYADKEYRVARFYGVQVGDEERRALLAEWGAAYVFYGPHERALGEFDPGAATWLRLAFRSGEVELYEVLIGAQTRVWGA
jgi:hypothetical protein